MMRCLSLLSSLLLKSFDYAQNLKARQNQAKDWQDRESALNPFLRNIQIESGAEAPE
jgi:hypothetical protein